MFFQKLIFWEPSHVFVVCVIAKSV